MGCGDLDDLVVEFRGYGTFFGLMGSSVANSDLQMVRESWRGELLRSMPKAEPNISKYSDCSKCQYAKPEAALLRTGDIAQTVLEYGGA